MVKIRINFTDPADDATIAPDGAYSLLVSNSTRPLSRPRGATPPKLAVVNALETTPLLQVTTTGPSQPMHLS
jgi:hypothetical protein